MSKREVKIIIQEKLEYKRELVLEVPIEMIESGRLENLVEKEITMNNTPTDAAIILGRYEGIEVKEYPDESLDSPDSFEMEVFDWEHE